MMKIDILGLLTAFNLIETNIMFLNGLHFIISSISIMSKIQRLWKSIYNRYKKQSTITQEGFCILSQQCYDIYKKSNKAGLFDDRDNFLLHISSICTWLSTLLVYNFLPDCGINRPSTNSNPYISGSRLS